MCAICEMQKIILKYCGFLKITDTFLNLKSLKCGNVQTRFLLIDFSTIANSLSPFLIKF